MRMVIIEIGNWLFHAIQEREEPKYSNSLGDAVRDGIPLPYNPTNGDVIKTMFPNAEYKHIKTMSGVDGMEVKGINGLYDNFGQWCARDIFFYDDWWNAPYRKDGETE